MRKKSLTEMQRHLNSLEELKAEYKQKGDVGNVRLISNMINAKYQELQLAKKESGD